MPVALAEQVKPDDLEWLATEARRLWHSEPDVESALRPALLLELADVELTLERLSLRASQTGLDDADLAKLEICRFKLCGLRCHWRTNA